MSRPGIDHRPLSKMDFLGMGPWMMNRLAKQQKNASPRELLEIAQSMGKSLGVSDTMALISSKLKKIIPWSGCALFLEEPGSNVLRCRYADGLDALRHGDAEQLRQLCSNQLAVGVRHASVESAHYCERANVLQWAAASIWESVLQIAQALHTLSNLVDALNERCSVACVGQ